MAIVQVQELIESGVHFGHRASRWNPKMRPYIYGKRNLIHIIDLRETVRGMLRGHRYLAKVASTGALVLFVGTKRQAKEAIEAETAKATAIRTTQEAVLAYNEAATKREYQDHRITLESEIIKWLNGLH